MNEPQALAPTTTEQRIAALEEKIAGYERMFSNALASPVARQVLATLGIKLPDRL